MGSKRKSSSIGHLRVSFRGCEYEASLDEAVKKEMAPLRIHPVVRGQITPAAGVGLSADIVVAILCGMAADVIVKALEAVFEAIRASAKNALAKDCHMGHVTIETERCDLIISANGSAGVFDESVDYGSLVERMLQLYESELEAGRNVISIETPCDLAPDTDTFSVRNAGVGNFSLWLISYREGEYWPQRLYDATNDLFIPLADSRIVDAINCHDAFYRTELQYEKPKLFGD